jgi:uncharacterized membrane protein
MFVVAGVLHFIVPHAYARLVPRWLAPSPEARLWLVWLSGVAELAGGLALLVPRLRVAAGWWLILVLLAVLPANVQMLVDARAAGASGWQQALLVARLPLQGFLIWWVWAAAIRPR